ncbi:MAG: MtnX-like HAD-IB family phosphatase [Ignavibacteriae bacterium]|nr:MtnX-like HAD-IB family phosphatase [Ignavibacteria bacterium]MBI3363641.1 MtnX-like HAD-IB family phosphatase [Ignavibacteriota bacterium]
MVRVFVDFDGTITRPDVGDAMFERFGGKQCSDAVEDYRKGSISAVECYRRESAACGTMDKSVLDSFLDSQEIDETFIAFVAFCCDRSLELTIVSDGMDYYIKRILDRHGLGDVKFYSNHLALVPVNGSAQIRFEPSFPYTDEVCDRCACCKRNHILTHSADEDIVVYVGEGYSDRCPARYADAVFAKDELLKYCMEENISYFEYRTFADVEERLRALLDNPGKRPALRKRRRAALARREAFIAE